MGLTIAAMPAYNEERSIGRVVSGVKGHVDRMVVVDDGSSDRTWSKVLGDFWNTVPILALTKEAQRHRGGPEGKSDLVLLKSIKSSLCLCVSVVMFWKLSHHSTALTPAGVLA